LLFSHAHTYRVHAGPLRSSHVLMAHCDEASSGVDRRCFIAAASLTAAAALTTVPGAFAIGDLPETLNQTRFVQHAVVNVPDIEVRALTQPCAESARAA
jgi:hypothetical protein